MALSKEQFLELRKKGLSVEQIVKFERGEAPQPTMERAPEPKSIIDRVVESPVSQGIQSFFPGKKLGEAVGTSIAAGGRLLRGDVAGARNIAESQVPVKQVAGDVIQTVALPATLALGVGTGATAISRIATAGTKYGALGAATGVGKSMTEDGSIREIAESGVKSGLVSGALGAGFQGLSEIAPLAQKGANKLLAKTSDTPEEAFNIINTRPSAAKQIGVATPKSALTNTQESVRSLRTNLTKQWEDGVKKIADEFSGSRVGLSPKINTTLGKVDELVGGLENMPKNTASISANELIKLQTEVNNLSRKPAFVLSPQGASIRKLADDLKELGVNAFGGQSGSYATFYKNYSTQKAVLDAADDIVRAYKTGKPITQTTALNRLQKIFDENKTFYLDAIKNLESATGKDLLSEIAASKFQGVLPKSPSIGGDIWTKTIKLLSLPLTSPRGAAWISQAVGGSGKIPQVMRAGLNVAIPGVSTLSATPQGQQQPIESTESSPDNTTFSPEVQRILDMRNKNK